MLADYKLYWDPKSNLLFFPQYDTKPVRGFAKKPLFSVCRFRPYEGCGLGGYPWFEAVKIASFGTWGLLTYGLRAKKIGKDLGKIIARDIVLAMSSRKKSDELFTNAKCNAAFREFAKANPSLRDARFAEPGSKLVLKASGIPRSARIPKPRAAKRAV